MAEDAQAKQASEDQPTPMEDQPNQEQDAEDRPSKWPKPHHKDDQKGEKTGKGGQLQRSSKDKDKNWRQSKWDWNQQDQELRGLVTMLTTLVLRQEDQQSITRQDSAFVLFLRTDNQGSLAHRTYAIAQQWKKTKEETPEALTMPMRATLFLLMTTAARLETLLSTQETVAQAQAMGWIAQDNRLYAMTWDNNTKSHKPVKDKPTILVTTLAQLAHGTRPLAAEYQSPTLTMLCEIGMRTEEATAAWKLMDRLCHSAAWLPSGCYVRHEKMQRSALAQRVAQTLSKMPEPYS